MNIIIEIPINKRERANTFIRDIQKEVIEVKVNDPYIYIEAKTNTIDSIIHRALAFDLRYVSSSR